MINENFARCTECDHPYFIPEKASLIAKHSQYLNPIVVGHKIIYKCEKCGHKQYEEE